MGLRKTTRREIKQIIIIILLSSGFFFLSIFSIHFHCCCCNYREVHWCSISFNCCRFIWVGWNWFSFWNSIWTWVCFFVCFFLIRFIRVSIWWRWRVGIRWQRHRTVFRFQPLPPSRLVGRVRMFYRNFVRKIPQKCFRTTGVQSRRISSGNLRIYRKFIFFFTRAS